LWVYSVETRKTGGEEGEGRRRVIRKRTRITLNQSQTGSPPKNNENVDGRTGKMGDKFGGK